MDIDLVFKLAALGIIVAVLNILLSRSGREEQALMVTIAGLVLALIVVVKEISELFALIRRLFS
jgi:stage III sporulation protein AC